MVESTNIDNASSDDDKKLVMDGSQLLSFLSREEASLPEIYDPSDDHRNHTPTPMIEIAQLLALGKPYCASDIIASGEEQYYTKEEYNGSVYLAVARSQRVCCCQVLSWNNHENGKPVHTDPIVLWRSMDYDYHPDEGENDDNEIEVSTKEEYITSSLIVTSPSLSSSASSIVSNEASSMITTCIVLGTSKSRVLSMELNIDLDEMNIANSTILPPGDYYEPLPFLHPQTSFNSTNDLSQLNEHNDSSKSANRKGEGEEKDDKKTQNASNNNDRQFHSFHPKGGVSSIYAFRKAKSSSVFVWISYMDGTAVQLQDCDFFKSLVISSRDYNYEESLEYRYPRSRVTIGIPQLAHFTPLPTSHTSILAPISLSKHPKHNATNSTIKSDSSSILVQALSYGGDNGYNNAHDPTKGGASISFYSSEDHSSRDPAEMESEQQLVGLLGGYVLGGAKSIVSGVSTVTSSVTSSIVGVMKWGWNMGTSNSTPTEAGTTALADLDEDEEGISTEDSQRSDIDFGLHHPNKPFLTEQTPQHVPHTTTVTDPPRRISSVSIDPTGKYAAVGDTLGRVLLIDLKSKQIVRMWKGFRESQCYWVQQYHSRRNNNGTYQRRQVVLYLVVHARQRSIVEVWRMKHGGRVKVLNVEPNANVLQCWESNGKNYNDVLAKCYILHSPGNSNSKVLEPLVMEDKALSATPLPLPSSTSPNTTSLSTRTILNEANIRNHHNQPVVHLKLLRQMLASDTNIPSNCDAVFSALTKIRSMADLNKALDLLAVATSIEEKMGVQGSSFHAKVIEHCQQFLKDVESEEGNEGIAHENIHAINLRKQIEYHSMIVKAYDALNRYEIGMQDDDGKGVDENADSIAPRTSWSVEAIKWIETYDLINDAQKTNLQLSESMNDVGIISFSAFAKACSVGKSLNDDRLKVHFCDSTKDRKAALVHVFHPFLQDIFVFNVVNSIFDNMGISDDHDHLLKYFGEWFISLPTKDSATASLFGTWCPILRWLQEIVVRSIDKNIQSEEEISTTFLSPLLDICMKASDLPKAFLLAAVSREAICLGTKQKEEKTYGKLSSSEAVEPWDELLRKLRVCLLISFRLSDVLTGQFPINPENIEDGNIFSVYEWLAHDEILISHKQDEIVSLENAYRSSIDAFNPCSPEGDAASKWKMLQKGCVVYAKNDNTRSSRLESSPLLLYFTRHIHSVKLAAHRALILSGKWGQKPDSLHLLKDAVSALRALKDGEETSIQIVNAVHIEIWQIYLRPVFRALLFGFEDVHELSEDVWTPLCADGNWVRGFAKVAAEVLDLIEHSEKITRDAEDFDTVTIEKVDAYEDDEFWPPLQKDVILQNLMTRNISSRTYHDYSSSLKDHRSIVAAVQLVADDLSILDPCISEESELFLQHSIYGVFFSIPDMEDKTFFLEYVLEKKAELFLGHSVDLFHLGEIEYLSETWQFPIKEVRSQYLLALYTAGKDAVVDLPVSSFQYIDMQMFIDGAFQIICTRLNTTIATLKKNKQLRGLIGTLDADTCEWIKDRTENAGQESFGEAKLTSLSSTHDLVLKVLQISSTNPGSKSIQQAHSISILTGTLLKEMEDIE